MNAETNPFLVVEVLSKSTYDHDWENKLPSYQSLPSVECILFIESRFPAITVFTRTAEGWDKAFFNEKEEGFGIRGKKALVGDVYRKTGYFGK
ncbi:MAG: Uma2 family endonuclease [Saprospiraceae bacterium]